MGQTLHGCARTTQAVRRSIQHSQATVATLAERHGIDRKTVAEWRKRQTVEDAPMDPKRPRSTVLTVEEATAVAFRKHTLLPLDDCLGPSRPNTRSSRRSPTSPGPRSTAASSGTESAGSRR
jgi:transposase-like protein